MSMRFISYGFIFHTFDMAAFYQKFTQTQPQDIIIHNFKSDTNRAQLYILFINNYVLLKFTIEIAYFEGNSIRFYLTIVSRRGL